MSIEPGTTLPKQIVLRNDPSERNFAATWKLMQERRRLYGIDPTNFRPRRKSGVVGIDPLPLVEEKILKPLSVLTYDAVEDDLEEVTIPEVCAPMPALVAGEDEELEIPIETGDESESDNQDDPSGIEPDGYSVEE